MAPGYNRNGVWDPRGRGFNMGVVELTPVAVVPHDRFNLPTP